ncbi:mercuric reductase [Aeropyrum pernix K1]|uniref:Mercuric reductase n=1 Tax=Aeropyrum pernix (strain ATCC 700893 / DSM 11879 / JCM 9820 / NBRC 100138 / K1) TaxID=272557 RepID=Q9YBZ2_AERPE|nr:mercury(II) reductase [Aeropyrum pernix]BAA80456.1 mercuric reductase [Aeropyrum pernix K1]
MLRSEYDIIVIGGGAAGFSAVVAAAEGGASVLLVSEGPLGGTCVNFGCVPSKHVLYNLSTARKAGLKISLSEALEGARKVSETLRKEKYESLLDSLGVDYLRGRARFKAPGIVEADGREVRYRKAAIIAVGARTWRPPIPGLKEAEKAGRILDNERLFGEGPPPDMESVAVIGGRAQGVEAAQIFARSGLKTVLLQRSGRLLPRDEPEAGVYMKRVLEGDGVEVRTSARPLRVESVRGAVRIDYETPQGPASVEASYIYLATGRKPVLDGLGLENVGVRVSSDGFIVVNEKLMASPGVYAAGDCIGGIQLEPVAAREGYVAALNALGGNVEMDYTVIPRAVFTDPEFASVGLTERELARKLGVCACRTVDITQIPRARIMGYETGFVKMVVDPRTKKVAGVHMMAPQAAEAIHEAAFILKAGMTVDDVIDTIHIFPSISEGIKYAALAFYRDVSKMPCCLL